MPPVAVAYKIDGKGPVVYFVHGIGSRKESWTPLVDMLKSDFTCVTFDLRGHGESPIPPTPYTLDQLTRDLEALRLKLGHHQIHVIGHSLGGMIGPAYARAYPTRTLSLGLLSTAAGRSQEDREKLSGVLAALKNNGIAKTLDTLVDRWYTDEFRAESPEAVQARLTDVMETPDNVFLSVFDVYASTEMGPWLHEITCPSLVLTGEFDGGCNPRLNQFIADQLPNSRLTILEHLRHDILKEAPELVANHLLKFLRQSIC